MAGDYSLVGCGHCYFLEGLTHGTMSREPTDLATATLIVGTAIAGVERWPALAFNCTTVELGAGVGVASGAAGRENEAAT
jgi:hypothetical protein